jgi:hypothetical protein
MNLFNFFRRFPNEQSCKEHFIKQRMNQGVTCKKCGSKEHYWLASKEQFQCKECDFRTTIRSGTVMEASKLPFRYWYATMHLLTNTKKSFSALELQNQLGHKRYEPIWLMLHKLRSVMGKSDQQYMLGYEVELDEGFFSNTDSKESKKTPVLVAAESIALGENEVKKKHRPDRKARFLKMVVLENRTKQSVFYETSKMIQQNTLVLTDGHHTFKNIGSLDLQHERHVMNDKKEVPTVFPWVHIAISNFRKVLVGIHHGVKSAYLQNYLNEFCYKFNRRYMKNELFDNLIFNSVKFSWYQNG